MKMNYSSHIKGEYHRRYEVARKTFEEASEEDKDSGAVRKPIAVQMRAEIGKEFWLLETEEFREKVAQDAEDAHMTEMQEWEEMKLVPKTPQQFHQ
jgi:hypothetical protein